MKTPHLEFSGLPDNAHRCTGETQGDWILYRCPLCAGYERRVNWKTGVTITRGQNEFQHFGSPGAFNNALALMQTAGKN